MLQLSHTFQLQVHPRSRAHMGKAFTTAENNLRIKKELINGVNLGADECELQHLITGTPVTCTAPGGAAQLLRSSWLAFDLYDISPGIGLVCMHLLACILAR